MTSSFPNGKSFSYPNWKQQQYLFYLFSNLNNKTDHIDQDHLRTDITAWNIEQPQQNCRLGTENGVPHQLLRVSTLRYMDPSFNVNRENSDPQANLMPKDTVAIDVSLECFT